MTETIIDGFIILLLAGAIGYGAMISRKVRRLMAVLEELEPLVEAYSSAVDKSEHSVAAMKQNLEAGRAAAESAEAAPAPEHDPQTFSSSRGPGARMPGMQVVRDKKDLVRMFFEASRSESRA
ncbi:flagellar motor switch protein [Shimia sp.]|uniref:flagellar motor switch protein n=1 Tax=Shimia sp. TaxID=1954381 RepID=UPI00356A90E5